eukprot:Nk52_evm5s649 gene=Nk52_evmTU5s649
MKKRASSSLAHLLLLLLVVAGAASSSHATSLEKEQDQALEMATDKDFLLSQAPIENNGPESITPLAFMPASTEGGGEEGENDRPGVQKEPKEQNTLEIRTRSMRNSDILALSSSLYRRDIFGTIYDALESAWNSLTGAAKSLYETASRVASNFVSSVKTFAQNTQDAFTAFGSGVSAGWSAFTKTFSGDVKKEEHQKEEEMEKAKAQYASESDEILTQLKETLKVHEDNLKDLRSQLEQANNNENDKAKKALEDQISALQKKIELANMRIKDMEQTAQELEAYEKQMTADLEKLKEYATNETEAVTHLEKIVENANLMTQQQLDGYQDHLKDMVDVLVGDFKEKLNSAVIEQQKNTTEFMDLEKEDYKKFIEEGHAKTEKTLETHRTTFSDERKKFTSEMDTYLSEFENHITDITHTNASHFIVEFNKAVKQQHKEYLNSMEEKLQIAQTHFNATLISMRHNYSEANNAVLKDASHTITELKETIAQVTEGIERALEASTDGLSSKQKEVLKKLKEDLKKFHNRTEDNTDIEEAMRKFKRIVDNSKHLLEKTKERLAAARKQVQDLEAEGKQLKLIKDADNARDELVEEYQSKTRKLAIAEAASSLALGVAYQLYAA